MLARWEPTHVGTDLGDQCRGDDDTWRRLKACPGDACSCAFYDQTRNNSREWCSMTRCGSRAEEAIG
ncbi:MAG: CGNR zinc finger domain-containing protein [Chloroflexi bacterium]|nr:CGNR zinc finger domain-containing protein [Chloroflexota bacterium]